METCVVVRLQIHVRNQTAFDVKDGQLRFARDSNNCRPARESDATAETLAQITLPVPYRY